MKIIKNYKNYDTLTLYVKKEKSDDIVERYKKLQWTIIEKKENKDFEDIYDITFSRPHNIENKDELQLHQVYMEDKLNNIAVLESHKYTKSTSFGLSFGIIGLIFSVLGILVFLNIFPSLNWIYGTAFSCIGFILMVLAAVFTPLIVKKEIKLFKEDYTSMVNELEQICAKIETLSGGCDAN